jgi:ChrR Cupin-like domain
MHKPELEFFDVAERPWVPVAGAPPGHYEKVLTDSVERMFVTRLMKVEPGCFSTETFMHDFWEEVYIVEGSQFDVSLGRMLRKGMYACRPPGMKHGPYRTDEGCVTLEVRYRL